MKKPSLSKLLPVSLFLMTISIVGCVALPAKPVAEKPKATEPAVTKPSTAKVTDRAIIEQYRTRAAEYENKGELRKALQSWEIVGSFNPNDMGVMKKINELKSQTKNTAELHYKKGLSYYKGSLLQAARREFLLALIYNPDHPEALYHVKNNLTGRDYSFYDVRKGDTLQAIAQRVYNDSGKYFLIAHYNDLGKDAKLTPGITLKLPVIDPIQAGPPSDTEDMPVLEDATPRAVSVNIEELLSKATNLYNAKKYHEVVSIAEKVLEQEQKNKAARDLLNASYYQMGMMMNNSQNYEEAIRHFNRVDSNYKDVKEAKSSAEKRLAEVHYITGVKYFVNDELDKAIKEWEITLMLNPKHAKAKKDIENAQGLLRKLQDIR